MMSPPATRLVVLAPNWLGDVIMALPALDAIRRWLPAAHLAVAARAPVAPVLSMVDGVDEVLTLEGRPSWRDGAGRANDAARLREGRFDAALLLPNSFHAAWLVRQAGIPERWGFRRDARGPLLTRATTLPRRKVTQAEYYLELVRATCGGGALAPPDAPHAPATASITVPQTARETAGGLLEREGWTGEPLVAFAPGAAFGPAKRWPADRVAQVAISLATAHHATPVFVGALPDVPSIQEVIARYGRLAGPDAARPIDLGGRTDLPMLAGIFTWCRAVVSNDSGAMHLAAAVGARVTAIFGPTDERATAPLPHPTMPAAVIVTGAAWCRPCLQRYCPIDHRCMTSIVPDRVVASVVANWGDRGAEAPRA